MLALCLMLSVTYFTQNYADVIGWSLTMCSLGASHGQYAKIITDGILKYFTLIHA